MSKSTAGGKPDDDAERGKAVTRQLAREVANQHGEKLPAFSSRQDAEKHLFAFRDKHLALLARIARKHPELDLNDTPASLKQLEQWYFRLYESDSFESLGITRETFEICMAMYFGETVTRNTSAQWIVEEYFLAPGKYELGVRIEQISIMLRRFSDHFRTPNNTKKQSLFRRYKQYFSRFMSTPMDLDAELKELLRQKKKISAIKIYQKYKLCSLEEARRYLESL